MKYTKEQFIEAVATSTSIAQVLTKLKRAAAGGNYRTVKNYIAKYSLDTSHMTGQLWSKGKKFASKRPIEEYLSNRVVIGSCALKERLLREGYLKRVCQVCNLQEWLEKPIPIELHHVDGNTKNNNLENLQLLCPNCHALTENYRGKAKPKRVWLGVTIAKGFTEFGDIQTRDSSPAAQLNKSVASAVGLRDHVCNICKRTFKTIKAENCKSCRARLCQKTKILWPLKEELLKLLSEFPYTTVAKQLGVSDSAVRKHLKIGERFVN